MLPLQKTVHTIWLRLLGKGCISHILSFLLVVIISVNKIRIDLWIINVEVGKEKINLLLALIKNSPKYEKSLLYSLLVFLRIFEFINS